MQTLNPRMEVLPKYTLVVGVIILRFFFFKIHIKSYNLILSFNTAAKVNLMTVITYQSITPIKTSEPSNADQIIIH